MSDSIALFPPSFLATQLATSLNSNVAIFEQPAELIATGNKNCIILESQALGAGIKSESQLQITGDIFEGDIFRVESAEVGTIRLEAKDSPSLLEFKTTATAGSAQAVALDLAAALNDALIFNRYYIADAFQGLGIVRIRAKTSGFSFTLVQSHVGNITALSTILGADKDRGHQKDNYGVYIDVFLGMDENYGFPIDKSNMCKIGTIEKKYQPDNLMEIDIAGLLDNETEFTPLDVTAPGLSYKKVYPWVALYGETFSENDTFRRPFLVGTTAVKWAIKAAVDIATYSDFDLVNYTVQTGATDICFLTNQPENKFISIDAKEYLSVLIKAIGSDKGRYLVGTIIPTFRDNTVGPEEVIFYQPTSKGGIYLADVSPENLPLGSIEAGAGKTIKCYTLQYRYATTLAQQAAPLTAPLATKAQKYSFLVRCFDNPTSLAFLNRWGCWDGVEVVGEELPNMRRQAGSFVKNIPCRPTQQDFMTGAKNINLQKTITYHTGWIDVEAFKWLDDLATSARVYTLKNGQQVASTVVGISLQKDNDKEKYFAEIEVAESAPFNVLKI